MIHSEGRVERNTLSDGLLKLMHLDICLDLLDNSERSGERGIDRAELKGEVGG
jgi:hypothetical protein